MNPFTEYQRSLLDGLAVVTPPTEIDISSADLLLFTLMSAGRCSSTVVLDMTATTFCDTSGFMRMTLAGDHLRAIGGDLRVVCSARMQMLMGYNKDDEHLSLFSSRTDALTPPAHAAAELVPAA